MKIPGAWFILGCSAVVALAAESPHGSLAPFAGPRAVDYLSGTLFTENDLYTLGTHSDQYYTTGQKFTVISDRVPSFETAFQSAWTRFFAKKVTQRIAAKAEKQNEKQARTASPDTRDESGPPATQLRVAYSFGQSMYTPAQLHTPVLQVDDRPYAAWLYLSVALQARSVGNDRRAWLSVWGADAGLVGPAALGKQVQDYVHDNISHSLRAEGWGHQLHNEPGLNLIHQSKLRWFFGERHGPGADATAHAGLSLGNVATYVNTGAALRLGYGLPDDFGTDVIRSGADTSQAGGFPPSWGAHIFGGFDVRAVGRDISFDGNTFRDSHHVAHEVFVGDFQFGLTINWGRGKICLSQVRRTPEFKLQGHAQAYGSIALTFPFSGNTARRK